LSLAIVGLLFIVVISYRKTIYEYPTGGGSYYVSKENLGQTVSLVAAASLLIDYILTVAVSIASGIAAITSAFPSLSVHKEFLCLIAIFILTLGNLRGLRESAAIFMFPAYAFVFGVFSVLGVGLYKIITGELIQAAPPAIAVQDPFTLFLLLRAFSSGCTAMTGVEAIADGVPAFKPAESKNAVHTLLVMVFILAAMFLGITFLSYYNGIIPTPNETVLSQLSRSIFDRSFFYYFIQFTTMGILIFAANTSFADFPRLASILARDRFLPRQFATQGDKLVFSNGIIMLGVLSALLILMFKANTHALIPLYAVGVFLSFTLSQAGMVRHWIKEHTKGWQRNAMISFVGMVITSVVTLILFVTKFSHGAWVIMVAIPLFVLVFLKINQHYISTGKQLSLTGTDPAQFPQGLKHTVLLPISGLHKGVIQALSYAQSIATDVRAVYIELDPRATERLQEEWITWGRAVPLVVLRSPYRSIIGPLLRYVDEVEESQHDDIVTILIPEFVTAKWWQQLLHNQTALLIRAALIFKKGMVVTSVRYHLE